MSAATAYVLLEDGTRFDGDACGADEVAVGEVVFTTGMSGYQESMTDPSFAGQLITFTYPRRMSSPPRITSGSPSPSSLNSRSSGASTRWIPAWTSSSGPVFG